jgi:hypothetical protein
VQLQLASTSAVRQSVAGGCFISEAVASYTAADSQQLDAGKYLSPCPQVNLARQTPDTGLLSKLHCQACNQPDFILRRILLNTNEQSKLPVQWRQLTERPAYLRYSRTMPANRSESKPGRFPATDLPPEVVALIAVVHAAARSRPVARARSRLAHLCPRLLLPPS